jgi:hypothetical protein
MAEAEEEARQVVQSAPPVLSDGRKKGPQHEKGITQKVAEQTGLSVDTVRRANVSDRFVNGLVGSQATPERHRWPTAPRSRTKFDVDL